MDEAQIPMCYFSCTPSFPSSSRHVQLASCRQCPSPALSAMHPPQGSPLVLEAHIPSRNL